MSLESLRYEVLIYLDYLSRPDCDAWENDHIFANILERCRYYQTVAALELSQHQPYQAFTASEKPSYLTGYATRKSA